MTRIRTARSFSWRDFILNDAYLMVVLAINQIVKVRINLLIKILYPYVNKRNPYLLI